MGGCCGLDGRSQWWWRLPRAGNIKLLQVTCGNFGLSAAETDFEAGKVVCATSAVSLWATIILHVGRDVSRGVSHSFAHISHKFRTFRAGCHTHFAHGSRTIRTCFAQSHRYHTSRRTHFAHSSHTFHAYFCERTKYRRLPFQLHTRYEKNGLSMSACP